VWEVVEPWLRSKRTIAARRLNMPRLIGVDGNPGLA
jgi:sulfur-oxidizing protein SoxB